MCRVVLRWCLSRGERDDGFILSGLINEFVTSLSFTYLITAQPFLKEENT